MSENDSLFAPNRVKQAISESCYDVPEVAEKIGKSLDLVYRWQQGSRQPRLDDLFQLAKVTRKPLEYFFGGTAPLLGSEPTPREALAVLSDIVGRLEQSEARVEKLTGYLEELVGDDPAKWPPGLMDELKERVGESDPDAADWEESLKMGSLEPADDKPADKKRGKGAG